MSAGIPEAFFHRKSLEIGEICNFAFYKQIFLCRRTAALMLHRKLLIAEKKFPVQADVSCFGLYFCFIHMDCFFSKNTFRKVLVKSFERIFHLYPNVPHS